MPKLITFSCFMLFWIFYEVSGGADFAPRERVIVSQAPFAQNTQGKTYVPPQTNAQVAKSAVQAHVTTTMLNQADTADAQAIAVPLPAPDLRYVAASRANLREGPSITNAVLGTVARGITAEVLRLNDAGWAQIRLTDSGQTGWMATRLLSEG